MRSHRGNSIHKTCQSPIENPSIGDSEGGAVLGAGLASVVEAGGGNVRMAEPLLDFAQVGAAVQGVRGRGGAQAETAQINPRGFRVFS